MLEPRERLRLRYRVRPPRRGPHHFAGCDLRLHSPARLWTRRRRLDLPAEVRVYPNFAEISRYTLLATNDQLAQMGVRRLQRRGSGAEFHQLREYRHGDTPAPNRLEGHLAHPQADRPRIPGRARSAPAVPARLRPTHAPSRRPGPRPSGRGPERPAAVGLRGRASGRRGRSDDLRRTAALVRAAQGTRIRSTGSWQRSTTWRPGSRRPTR